MGKSVYLASDARVQHILAHILMGFYRMVKIKILFDSPFVAEQNEPKNVSERPRM